MNAGLVFDGGEEVHIPYTMGSPLPDQMIGTPHERLGEVSARICYDSLGLDPETGKRRGRSTELMHPHLLETKNHSVYEHANFTIGFDWSIPFELFLACANRKGIWIELNDRTFQLTTNYRAILEWERHTKATNQRAPICGLIGNILKSYAFANAPAICPMPDSTPALKEGLKRTWEIPDSDLNEDQIWISLWLEGSRGFTHEQVRHRFAISQRSTRFVDEDGSEYEMHPLIRHYLNNSVSSRVAYVEAAIEQSIEADRKTYRMLVTELQSYCINQMGFTDKTAARKQARGAARGYLGNALRSEMIFSTSITGWKWILSQRKNKLADAEIREIYSPALTALKNCRYGAHFDDFNTVPSPDGIGSVLA